MTYALSEEHVWKKVGNKVVILNLDSGRYHSLNESASVIWDGIMEKLSEEKIIETMCDCFDVDKVTCARDAQDIIRALLEKKIIHET